MHIRTQQRGIRILHTAAFDKEVWIANSAIPDCTVTIN